MFIILSETLVLVCTARTMTQGELEFLCGPWQKTGADKTPDEGKQQRNATAEDAGPSAAAWPERREMARAPRHGPSAARAAAAGARRIVVCNIEAETRGIAWTSPAALR